jgi:hypothetical protein
MANSVARLLLLVVGLLVLCVAASGSLSADPVEATDCQFAVCAPGSSGCVDNCTCEGSLGCCQGLCARCCG